MTMLVDEKHDVDHIEQVYDSPLPGDRDIHPEQDWTQEEERAIVKKADWRVFPMLCIVVFILNLAESASLTTDQGW